MKTLKKIILIGFAVMLISACQQEQRYFAESSETKTLEAGIAAYESGDWSKWKSHFADTAKIHVNSNDPVTVDVRAEGLKNSVTNFSSYGFDKEKEYIEMVIDKEKETWVYYWATWNGELKANKKKLSVPVHLAAQFKDGKIVEEHVYFDGTAMNNEMAALSNMSSDEQLIQKGLNNIAKSWIDNDLKMFNENSVEKMGRSVNGIPVVNNQKDYNSLIQSNHDMLSNIDIVIKDMFIKDNKAYFKWTFSGENTKDVENMPATNKPIKINGFSIWSFNEEGKATWEDVYFDQNDVNIQMGFTLVPPKQ